jgi:hypothetical protein
MIERLTAFLNGTSFHRGLALGALVGAAIAGSTLWGRIRGRRGGEAPEASTEATASD